jgi:hypothetical protein
MFQNEWDTLMLETFTLKKHVDTVKQVWLVYSVEQYWLWLYLWLQVAGYFTDCLSVTVASHFFLCARSLVLLVAIVVSKPTGVVTRPVSKRRGMPCNCPFTKGEQQPPGGIGRHQRQHGRGDAHRRGIRRYVSTVHISLFVYVHCLFFFWWWGWGGERGRDMIIHCLE